MNVRSDTRSRGANRGQIRQIEIAATAHVNVYRVADTSALHVRFAPQLPGAPWLLGKNRSFHDSALTLIEPILYMKSTYFITFCGVVV